MCLTRCMLVTRLAIVGLAATAAPAQVAFDRCGTLVAGAECVLFRADLDGNLYGISNRGSFVTGERVRVVGQLDPACQTACQQGSGCIEQNSIEPCPPQIDACGVLVAGAACALFQPDGELRTYALENLGDFGPGDRVRVTGTHDASCLIRCGSTSGCIVGNTIRPGDGACPPATPVCPLATLGLSFVVPLAIVGLHGAMRSAAARCPPATSTRPPGRRASARR